MTQFQLELSSSSGQIQFQPELKKLFLVHPPSGGVSLLKVRGIFERQRREALLGGSGGMLPPENF
jgi:hypothetical protein